MSAISSSAARTPAAAPVTAAAGRRRRGQVVSPAVALGSVLIVFAAVPLANPVLMLCGLTGTTAALLLRRVSADLALPAAALLLLGASTLLGVAAGEIGVDLLTRPWVLIVVFLTYSAAGAYWCRRPAGSLVTVATQRGRLTWAAYAPALVAAAVGIAQWCFERMPVSWAFAGTDFTEHLLLVQAAQRSGSLDYASSAYPRGLHFLLALVSVPAPPHVPAAQLTYDTRLLAAATWLSLALLLWTASALALRVGAGLRVPPRVAVFGAAVFGAGALLTNSFLAAFPYMGAAPSIIAVTVLLVLPLAGLGLTGPARSVALPVLGAAAVMLLAHLWQALIVVPPLALGAYAAPSWRTLPRLLTRRAAARPWRRSVLLAVGSLAMLGVAAVPLLSVQAAGGVGLASIPGNLPHVPWIVLGLGVAVCAWLCRDLRHDWVRLYLGSVVGLLVVFAVLLRGAGNGLDVRQYYPMKGLWFLVLVLGPVVAVLVADVGRRLLRPLWLRLDRLGSAARVSRICLAALICAIAFTFWLPQLLGNAALTGTSLTREPVATGRVDRTNFTSVSAERYDIATRYVGRYRPAVTVPVAVGMSLGGSADGPHLVSKLMVFQDGQPETLGHPASVCTDVAAVTATGADAVVMTQMNVATLRAAMLAQGCAGVRVAKIPGGSFDD